MRLKDQFWVGEGGWIAWGALTAITGFGSFVWQEQSLEEYLADVGK